MNIINGVIDRIEDTDKAVINIRNYGSVTVPADLLGFKPYEGAHIKIICKHDRKGEQLLKGNIKDIQKELQEKEKRRKDNE